MKIDKENLFNKITEMVTPIIENHHKILISVKDKHENEVDSIEIIIDDPISFTIDIDEITSITTEILDEINDLIPDNYYLEVSSLGIERELKNDNDLARALHEYIYVKTYQKIEINKSLNEKEFYGYLESYNENEILIKIMIKTREQIVTIPVASIAKMRLAVKF